MEPYYNLPDEDDAESSKDKDPKPSEKSSKKEIQYNPAPLAMMLRILANPGSGWRNYKASKFTPSEVEKRCFYPLTGLLALSSFINLIYFPESTVSDLLIMGIIDFISYFFGYFVILLMAKIIMPKASRHLIETNFGKDYILMGLSTMALFKTIQILLPMLEPLLVFLPLWTIFVMSKGVKFLRVPKEKENITAGLLTLYVVGIPMVLRWIFDFFSPTIN